MTGADAPACDVTRCGAPAVGFLKPGDFGDPPELFVGQPTAASYVAMCAGHLVEAMHSPTLLR